MATDPQLIVALSARTDAFERELRKAGGIADKQVRDIEKSFAGLNAFFRTLGGTLAGAFSVDALKGIIDAVDDIGDAAERVALTTDALQALRFEMVQAGSTTAGADAALARFAVNVGKAADGTTYLARVFAANNIAMKDASGQFKSQEQLLFEFARLVTNAATEQDKLRLATEAFGREGAKMLPVLKQIATDGIGGLVKAAKDAGTVIDKDLIDQAGEVARAWDTAMLQASTAVKKFVLEVIGAGRTWTTELANIRLQGRTWDEYQRGAEAAGRTLNEIWSEEFQRRRAAANLPPYNPLEGAFTFGGQPTPTTVIPPRREARTAREETRQAITELGELSAEQKKLFDELTSAAREFSSALSTGFKDLIFEGKEFDQVLRNIVKRLSSHAIDRFIDMILKASVQSMFNPLQGAFSFGPGRQTGGPVRGGQPYVVGERGAELFVPNTSGRVIPNSRAAGLTAPSLVFAPRTAIDARGSTMTEQQFRAILAANNRVQQKALRDQLPGLLARQSALGKI